MRSRIRQSLLRISASGALWRHRCRIGENRTIRSSLSSTLTWLAGHFRHRWCLRHFCLSRGTSDEKAGGGLDLGHDCQLRVILIGSSYRVRGPCTVLPTPAPSPKAGPCFCLCVPAIAPNIGRWSWRRRTENRPTSPILLTIHIWLVGR